MNIKIILSTFLFAIFIPAVATARSFELKELPFSDKEPDMESALAVQILSDEGVLKGNPDGTFGWNDELNRAAFITIIMRLSGKPLPIITEKCFPDVELGSWYAQSVCYAKKEGYVQGNAVKEVSQDQWLFEPERIVQYEEAVKILSEKYHRNVSEQKKGEEWYVPYLRHAHVYRLGLEQFNMKVGVFPEAGKDSAGKKLTRAEMAQLTARFFLNYSDDLDGYLFAVEQSKIIAEKEDRKKQNSVQPSYSGKVEKVEINGKQYTYFPLGWDGRPLSTNLEWNRCIRLNDFSISTNSMCAKYEFPVYRGETTWNLLHPDLKLPFVLNRNGGYIIPSDENYIPRIEPVSQDYENRHRKILAEAQLAYMDGVYLLSLPRNEEGIPISSYDSWNNCIMAFYEINHEILENDCQDFVEWDPKRTNDDYIWFHPDLLISFSADATKLQNLEERYKITDSTIAQYLFEKVYALVQNPLEIILKDHVVVPGSTVTVGSFVVRHEYRSVIGGGSVYWHFPIHVEEIEVSFHEFSPMVKSVKLVLLDGSLLGEMKKEFAKKYSFKIPNPQKLAIQYGSYFGVIVQVELSDSSEQISQFSTIQIDRIGITGDRKWNTSSDAETSYSPGEFPIIQISE
ncbi:MAG TPA: S-layer homology domain-containing protein [Candidatus Peribacterales bacterium]|nr:S-layer homology domain-containing protein [Candidatus Peribacterales bacterium]